MAFFQTNMAKNVAPTSKVSKSNTLCFYGSECSAFHSAFGCKYIHPCRYGMSCSNIYCKYDHPHTLPTKTQTQPSQTPQPFPFLQKQVQHLPKQIPVLQTPHFVFQAFVPTSSGMVEVGIYFDSYGTPHRAKRTPTGIVYDID